MFKKPFKTKSNTRLRTSDKKKFRNELIKQFPSLAENKSLEILNIKANVSVIELITHSGDSASIYSIPKYPCFVHFNDIFIPTVFILWEIPELLYQLTTNLFVFEKIQGGADLMLPGVIIDEPVTPESYGSLKKGDLASVVLNNCLDTVAVGEALMNSEDMFLSGKKGKCLHIIHYYGDQLCALAKNVSKPMRTKDSAPDPPKTEVVNGGPVSQDCSNSLNFELNVTESNLSDQLARQKIVDDIYKIIQFEPYEGSMEETIMFCFMKALVTSVKKAQLPLLTNVFYRVHMREVYPDGSRIDIKKSMYKKLSTFLDCMSQIGIIKLESNSVGVHRIISIDYSHYLVREFLKDHPVESTDKVQQLQNQGPNISEKYTINAAVLPLFSKFGYKKGDPVNQADVRKAITSYVKNENLQDESDKRFILLNPLLSGMLKKEVRSVTWEDLMRIIVDLMGQSYQVNVPNKTITGKGKLSPIDIQVSTRSGNKKVTLINNLELYGINLQDFSKECQHGVSASTTINSLPHSAYDQLQVQGSHVNFIGKLLTEKYKVPKRYITGWVPK